MRVTGSVFARAVTLFFLINCKQNNIDDSFVLLSNSYAPPF